jgi:hypothetical protein
MQSLRAWVAPLSALTLAAIVFAAPALAQEGEPGGNPPGEPQSAAPASPPVPPGAPPMSPAPPPEEAKGAEAGAPMKSAYVPSRLNLRQTAGVDSSIMTVIPAGSMVQVADCTNGWCSVEYQGQHGYAIATGLGIGRVRHADYHGPPPDGHRPGEPPYGGAPAYYGPPPVYYGAPYYYYGPRYYYYYGPRWGYYRPW